MPNTTSRLKLLIAMLLVALCCSAQPYKWRYDQHVDFSNVNNLDSLADTLIAKFSSEWSAFNSSYDIQRRFKTLKDIYDVEYEMGEFGLCSPLPFMMLPKKGEHMTLEDRALQAKYLCHAYLLMGNYMNALLYAQMWKDNMMDIIMPVWQRGEIITCDEVHEAYEIEALCYYWLGYEKNAVSTLEELARVENSIRGKAAQTLKECPYDAYGVVPMFMIGGLPDKVGEYFGDITLPVRPDIFKDLREVNYLLYRYRTCVSLGDEKGAKNWLSSLVGYFYNRNNRGMDNLRHPLFVDAAVDICNDKLSRGNVDVLRTLENYANDSVCMAGLRNSRAYINLLQSLVKWSGKYKRNRDKLDEWVSLGNHYVLNNLSFESSNASDIDMNHFWENPMYKQWLEETLPEVVSDTAFIGVETYFGAYAGINLSKMVRSVLQQTIRKEIASKGKYLRSVFDTLFVLKTIAPNLEHRKLNDTAYAETSKMTRYMNIGLNKRIMNEVHNTNNFFSKFSPEKLYHHLDSVLNDSDMYVDFFKYKSGDDVVYGAMKTFKTNGYVLTFPYKLFTEKELLQIPKGSIYTTKDLYNLVWRKLIGSHHGAETRTVYFSSAGLLNTLGIEYVVSSDGRRMDERFNMHRVTATYMVGDKDYDNVKYTKHNVVMFGDVDMNACKKYFSELSPILPNTGLEISKIHKENRRKADWYIFRHKDATEKIFKRLNMQNVNILHVASHSYFWDADKADANGDMPFINSKVYDKYSMGAVSEEDNILSRTGILMSDMGDDGVYDGVLTAAEISCMYMEDLDLVVLSACNTASGEISGEGTLGLQYAFKKAGAKSILMTLWDVDDEATQILMTEFYRALFSGGTKHDALKQAQECLRKYNGGIYASPYYWAAFVLLEA